MTFCSFARRIFLFLALVVCLSWAVPVAAYIGGDVEHGGRITGTVTLDGPIPEPRVFPMVLYPFGPFCKKISDGKGHVRLREFNVDGDGGLKDAVVAIQAVTRGKRFAYQDVQLVSVNCMFHPADVSNDDLFEHHGGDVVHLHPLVSIMRNDWPLTVVNQDPILHGVQVYQKETGHRVLGFPLPPVSGRIAGGYMHLREGKRIAQIICPMHEYMQTWGWVVDNPYYARTNRDGRFVIDDIPPGTYRVTAWHPHMAPIERVITVPADGAVALDFVFDAGQVARPVYERQEKFRISPESDPYQNLEGCEGPFCVRH
jgi:hypothetical protein